MKNIYKLLALAIVCLHFNRSSAQTVTFTLTQAPCNANGILTANFSGFTPPLTVAWGSVLHTGVTGSSDALTGYSGQPLSVKVTDVNNVSTGAYYQGAPPFQYTVSVVNGVCPALGTATATVTGGTSPYTFQWTDQATSTVVSTSNPASLATGNYDIMITDANGCVYGSMYRFDSISIYNTSSINFAVAPTTASCTNGTATVSSITGGTSPYSILWSNAATTSSITGLTKGLYFATVTDAIGCSTTKGAYVSQSVNIGASTTVTPATCLQNNGAVTCFGSGGTPPYSYLWNNSATTQSQTGLAAGIYNVTVTDANGCIGSGSAYVSSSTPVNVTYSTTASSCTSATGSATLSITGGTAPYSVQWNVSPAQTGTTLINVPAGNYYFTVTDAVGCVRTGVVNISPVNQISLNVTSTNATCTQSNGSIGVTPSGGSAPYTYLWSNSATTSAITNVPAGSYSVKVTDNVGCSVTKYRTVGVTTPVTVGISSTVASCQFNSDGAITATPAGGTAPYTYSWSNAATTATISGLPKGNYWVNVADAAGCKGYAYASLGYNASNNSCYCAITGTVYNDLNNNCVKDAGEPGIENIQVHCSSIGYAYTNANGVYSFKVPSGAYTISETVLGYYPLASCQNNAITVNATAGTNCTHTVDFANTINPIHDVSIQTWNYTCPVPGYVYKQRVIVKNAGTVTEPAIVSGYNTDGQISTPAFSPAGIFTGSGNQYNITGSSLSLNAGETKIFTANYNMPSNIPLNTSLVFKDSTAYITPMSNWLNDYSPWDNVNYYTPVVVGSYDPNFKEVNPKGQGVKGLISNTDTVLEYMIHFQNLGTYKAQNIVVLDTLDADLDWTTMKPVYQSHNCNISMSDNGVIRFQFDNIDLPAKIADEEGSNGMVSFSIKTKSGLPDGTEFTNNAAIYFDFNEPVITNTTLNTIGKVSVKNIAKGGYGNVTIYPNPTNDAFTIKVNEGAYRSVKVMNAMGQVYTSRNITGKETRVDLSAAAPGIYFIMLQGEYGYKIEKVEKL